MSVCDGQGRREVQAMSPVIMNKQCPKCKKYNTIKMYQVDTGIGELVLIYACYDCHHRWEEPIMWRAKDV